MKKFIITVLLFLSLSAFAAPFQGVCNAVTDATPALNAQAAAAMLSSDKEILFPSGQCAFYSAPAPIKGGVSLIGQSKSTTVFMRKYSGSLITLHGQGSRIENLTLYAEAGTSGGIGIHAISSEALGAGGNHVLRSIWVTGNGTWAIPVFLDGSGKTADPKGIRTVTAYDLSVFNATSWALECWDCVGFEWFGGGAYQGFGTTQAVVVGGSMGANSYINSMIDRASSTIYPSAMRVQP
jgi:hypothetical protein